MLGHRSLLQRMLLKTDTACFSRENKICAWCFCWSPIVLWIS